MHTQIKDLQSEISISHSRLRILKEKLKEIQKLTKWRLFSINPTKLKANKITEPS